MSKRHRQDEIVFGSDSFLDILANIVGILIILIVVAGMKVSRAPAKLADTNSETQAVASASIVPLPDIFETTLEPELEPPILEGESIAPPVLSEELVGRVKELQATVSQLEAQRAQLVSEEQQLASRATLVRQSVIQSQQDLERERSRLSQGSQAIAALDETLNTTQRELASLQVTLDEAETEQPNTTVLKHKLNPVGKQVSGKQILFLLTGDRVAVVPTDELLESFLSKRQMILKRLLTSQQYSGTLGPIQGFKMEYVVDRVTPTLVEELKYGRATIGARLSIWQFIPQENLVTESAADALQPNSRFLSAIREADRDATLTFFVYPDSFVLHRELQEFAHDQGFEVAGNPLLSGQPITIVHADSPLGTPSVAQ